MPCRQRSAGWHQTISGIHGLSSNIFSELMVQPDGGKKLGEKIILRRNLKVVMQVLHSLQDLPLRNHNRVQQKRAALK